MGSAAALVCAYAIRFLAIASGALEAGLARIPPSLEQAARLLGESPGGTLRRVHLPLLRPAIAGAALLVFVDAMKELPATLLLRPMNFDTLATWLYAEAARGTYEEGAVAALAIVAAGLIPVILLARAQEHLPAARPPGPGLAPCRTASHHDRITRTESPEPGLRHAAWACCAWSTNCPLVLPGGHIGCLLGPLPAAARRRCCAPSRASSRPPAAASCWMARCCPAPHRVAPERRRVGMMFQDYALFPHLSVSRNVGFGLRRLPRAERERRVAEMLELVSWRKPPTAFRTNFPAASSSASRWPARWRLRRTCCCTDEPFSNLDADARERLAFEVRDILKHTGHTAILVDARPGRSLRHRRPHRIMAEGRVAQWDTPYNLQHHLGLAFVADFIRREALAERRAAAYARGAPSAVAAEDSARARFMAGPPHLGVDLAAVRRPAGGPANRDDLARP